MNTDLKNPQKFPKLYQKTRRTNKFSKVAGYKRNTLKSIVFLYTKDEPTEKESKKIISFKIPPKN